MYLEICRKQIFLFGRDEEPTAKKEHECCECGRTIRIGEKYSYFACAWQEDGFGKFFRAYKICLECQKVWNEILDVFYQNGKNEAYFIYGLLNEAIQEASDEGFLKEDDRLVRYVNGNNKRKEAYRVVAQMRVYSAPLL